VGLWVLLLGCGIENAEPERQPNVLLILVDTLRKDHLHLYGYERRTSDTIDALGAEGWVLENHIASASQTVPSTLSMMLSRHPSEHGFVHLENRQFQMNRPRYPEAFLFLAEVFRDAGYATAAFVSNPFLQRENGFAQGFETFLHSEERAETLTLPALEWLAGRASEPARPFFLYMHYFDVHWPYDPPPEYRDRFPIPKDARPIYSNGPFPGAKPDDLAATISLYDGEIAFVDGQIAQILDALERLGMQDDTILVVTSDHGDEFLDHGGLGHGTTVYGELVRVPLVLVYPGRLEPGRRIEYLTHHIDLAPTLAAFAGIETPPTFRGRSLFEPADRAFAENGSWRAVYDSDRKLVLNRKTGEVKVFDRRDELDQHPLSDQPSRARLLEHLDWYQQLERDTAGSVPDASAPWTESEVEKLRALGYVD